MSDMKDENIIILYQCSVTVDSIVKSDVLAYRQCLFSYYVFVCQLWPDPLSLFLSLCFSLSLSLSTVLCYESQEHTLNRKVNPAVVLNNHMIFVCQLWPDPLSLSLSLSLSLQYYSMKARNTHSTEKLTLLLY